MDRKIDGLLVCSRRGRRISRAEMDSALGTWRRHREKLGVGAVWGGRGVACDGEERAWLQTLVMEGIVGWMRFLGFLVKLGYRETRTDQKLGENKERL
jgi:hypothetical protein